MKFFMLSKFINCVLLQLLVLVEINCQSSFIRSPFNNVENNNKPLKDERNCESRICRPQPGDLLIGRQAFLTASSTCGLNEPQRYCVMGPRLTHRKSVKKGQKNKRDNPENVACFVCDSRYLPPPVKNYSHHIQNVIDNRDKKNLWWQSENNKEDVYIQFDLEAEFLFTHLYMNFKTFRPYAMLIEKSTDYGLTWKPIAYFADSCRKVFPDIPTTGPTKPGDVRCKESYSKELPSREGGLAHKVIPPSLNHVEIYSPETLEALKLTNLRFNFTRLFRLGDENLDVDTSNEQIVDKYYYAVRSIQIFGQCNCNGHGSRCIPIEGASFDEKYVNTMVHGGCECVHNTMGEHCEQCKPLYNDWPWEPANSNSPNMCKKCQCNNHADRCIFDNDLFQKSGGVSGGICICSNNTEGRNCERCKPRYWHDQNLPFTHEKACKECNCDMRGSDSEFCNTGTEKSMEIGQCFCKENVMGRRCDRCKPGFRNLRKDNPNGCEPCSCNVNGTIANQGCEMSNGQCKCKEYVTGQKCDQCMDGYYGLDDSDRGCKRCDCSPIGSDSNVCDKITGQCPCRPHNTGRTCSEIETGYYCPAIDYLTYEAETAVEFDSNAGLVENSYLFSYPQMFGSIVGHRVKVKNGGGFSMIINNFGDGKDFHLVIKFEASQDWKVQANIDGIEADTLINRRCKRYSFMSTFTIQNGRNLHSLEDKFCFDNALNYKVHLRFSSPNYMGTSNSYILIDSIVLVPVIDELSKNVYDYCKNNFNYPNSRDYCMVFICPTTAKLFGMQPCDCDEIGSKNSTCRKSDGQCPCRDNVIGKTCNTCDHETWGLSIAGCKPCGCTSSSSNNFCDKDNGQCKCNSNTHGRVCQECRPGFWGPPTNCIPCNCNGFSEACNSETGICDNCTSNTTGNNCESCKSGFYGDPQKHYPCKECMCPGINGIQHGDTCYLDHNTESMVCNCREGYIGQKCDECDKFYFGNPLEPDGKCQKCDCNGNVDENDSNSCDSETGQCSNCLHNTDGIHCEKCKNGYHGDAKFQLCYPCDCYPNGTEGYSKDNCDPITGKCKCLPNVKGSKCNETVDNYYWDIKGGALPCNCDTTGTVSGVASCDEKTGQCSCNDERGGQQCDQCADTKWGDPLTGCKDCHCDGPGSLKSQCDKVTGDCLCKKGVVGKNCDQCDKGTTGSVPECEPCGECFNNWDNILTELKMQLEILEMKALEAAAGLLNTTDNFYDLHTALAEIEAKLNDVKALLNKDSHADHRISKLENQIRIISEKIDSIKNKGTEAYDKINMLHQQCDFSKMKDESKKVAEDFYILSDETRNLSNSFSKGATANIIKYKNLSDHLENALIDFKEKIINMKTDLKDFLNSINLEDGTNPVIDKFNEDINDIVRSLSELNNGVCGSSLLGCEENLCGAPGCGRCANEKSEIATSPFYTFSLFDDSVQLSASDDEDCSSSVRAKFLKYFEAYKMFNEKFGEIEKNLKDYLIEARRINDEIGMLNKESLQSLENITRRYESFIDTQNKVFEFIKKNLEHLKEVHEYISSTFHEVHKHIMESKIPKSEEEFNEIMNEVDRIAAGISDRAEKIESETEDLKNDAFYLKKTVEDLENEQKPVLEEVEKIKEEFNKNKETLEQNENKINEIELNIKEVSDIQAETNETLKAVDSSLKNSKNNLIGGDLTLSVSSSSIERVQHKVKKNDDHLSNLKQQLDELDEITNKLEEKIISGLTGSASAENREVIKNILELRKNIQEKKNLLEERNEKLNSLRAEVKAKRQELANNNKLVTELLDRVNLVKENIVDKMDYFDTCY